MRSISAKPTTIQTILVPCDFSECSFRALEYAVVLGQPFGASVVLLHVIEPVQPGFLVASHVTRQLQGQMREQAGQQLGAWIKRRSTGLNFRRPLVRAGRPWEIIVSTAHRTGADLIVMGTHGHTGLKHAVLGSVAERVVRHAACPVLTMRSKSK